MNIIVYGNGCSNCKNFTSLLDNKKLEYSKVEDMNEIMEVARKFGFKSMPIVKIDEDILDYVEAKIIINGVI